VIKQLLTQKILKVLPTVIKKGASKPTEKEKSDETESTLPSYTPDELQFIITTLGEQTFKVKEIEFIYNLIVKLQGDYLTKTQKK
jgi:hypothetical protein